MNRHSGQLLLIALLLTIFSVNLNRTFSQQEEGPVFLVENSQIVTVELGIGFDESSIHQFIDGSTLLDVIKLTGRPLSASVRHEQVLTDALQSGQRIDLTVKNDHIDELRVTWMPAAKRIALGIALHPDRMNQQDWQVLPGIGKKMAMRIEQNRQNYGDFGTFWNLKRVPGLGEKRLTSWNQYFFSNSIAP